MHSTYAVIAPFHTSQITKNHKEIDRSNVSDVEKRNNYCLSTIIEIIYMMRFFNANNHRIQTNSTYCAIYRHFHRTLHMMSQSQVVALLLFILHTTEHTLFRQLYNNMIIFNESVSNNAYAFSSSNQMSTRYDFNLLEMDT